jgi:hypothetical protein
VQGPHVHNRLYGFAAAGTENISCSAFELRFPARDLVGMDVELLRKKFHLLPCAKFRSHLLLIHAHVKIYRIYLGY